MKAIQKWRPDPHPNTGILLLRTRLGEDSRERTLIEADRFHHLQKDSVQPPLHANSLPSCFCCWRYQSALKDSVCSIRPMMPRALIELCLRDDWCTALWINTEHSVSCSNQAACIKISWNWNAVVLLYITANGNNVKGLQSHLKGKDGEGEE